MVNTKINLSMTEPYVRQIYAKQGDTGRVLEIGLEDALPENGTLRILRPDGVEKTSDAVSSDSPTITDGMASFDSLDEAEVTSLKVGISPIQDLHGYDNPWPSGGGVNKLPPYASASATSHNIVLTNNDGQYSLTGEADATWLFDVSLSLPIGTYTFCALNPASNGTISVYVMDASYNILANISLNAINKTQQFTTTVEATYVRIRGTSSTNVTNFLLSPMIVSGTTAPTSWSPYSNICPIYPNGSVNVWDEEWENGYWNHNNNGAFVSNANYVCCKNYIEVEPNTSYWYQTPTVARELLFYDKSKNMLSYQSLGATAEARAFTTPNNCYYVTFYQGAAYGTTYNNDISINCPYSYTNYISYPNQIVTVYDDGRYGGLVTFNQLITNGDFADSTNWQSQNAGSSVSVADNVAKVTWNSGSGSAYNPAIRQGTRAQTIIGHKYFIAFDIMPSKNCSSYFSSSGLGNNSIGSISWTANVWNSVEKILTATANGDIFSYIGATNAASAFSTGDSLSFRNIMALDLTQMFGEGNEPTTVEQFKALFPKDYYAYNSGTEMTVSEVNGEPYRKIPLSLGQTVYGGTLDVVSGKLVVDKVLFSLTEFDVKNSSNMFIRSLGIGDIDGTKSLVACNYLPIDTPSHIYQGMSGININYTGNGYLWAYSDAWVDLTTAQLKTLLQANPLTILGYLATPLEVDLTPTQITTLLGTNNMWADGEISELTFDYGKLLSVLTADQTEVVGRCLGDVNFGGASTMPFTLVVKPNNKEQ